MQKKITAQQFKEEYAELKTKFGAVKAELKKIKTELGPLCRRADALFRKAERSLYSEAPGKIVKPAFRGLDRMVDDIIGWSMARDAVMDAADIP